MNGETAKIDLARPILKDGKEVKELTMRRPKVKDMRLARVGKNADDNAAIELALMGNLCGLTPEEMDSLDWGDYGALQETFAGFNS